MPQAVRVVAFVEEPVGSGSENDDGCRIGFDAHRPLEAFHRGGTHADALCAVQVPRLPVRSECRIGRDEVVGLRLDYGGESRNRPRRDGTLELMGETMALTDAINGAGMGCLVSQGLMELTGTPGGMLMPALHDGLLSVGGDPMVRSLRTPR